ncbi:unnamed protein product [Acanthoscelides obtectus]|uniref:Uncharacterized protein n=1 Tax=Acanthoscelides obtectus TaxID=200917 RepID=A0A9P0JKS7_ACAOB|nr:unnamed protein product [Acanthoscelides obtectus]CAK1672870.1 hypothetical protein AOBTE_LOCUS29123 [Acanthoscelides obtectus]
MESNSCSADDFSRYDNHVHITMDHDSGYISHNPESNLDSPLESLSENSHISEPVFLSEDALLERPTISKSDLSLQIENENYEETRQLFFNVSDNETVIPASVSSSEDNFGGLRSLDSSSSNKSTEIPISAPIVVESKATFDITTPLENVNESSKATEDTSTAFTNITNTLATADPKKKLVLVLAKSDKENMYTVKRKYRSLTPEPEKQVNSSYDSNLSKNSISDTSMSLDETLNNPILTSKSMREPKNENLLDQKCDKKNESTCTAYSDISMDLSLVDKSCDFDDKIESKTQNILDYPAISTHDACGDNKKQSLMTDNQSITVISADQNSGNNIINCTVAIKSEYSNIIRSDEVSVDQQLTVSCDVSQNIGLIDISDVGCVVSTNSTPKKEYINPANTCMSPDLFEEEESVRPIIEPNRSTKQVAEEKYLHKKDSRLIRRIQDNLKGVLPPQSVTICTLSVDEILKKIESNKSYFWNNETVIKENLNVSNESIVPGESRSLLITAPLKECTEKEFPHILGERNHGLHFNSSRLSEQLEDLYAKFAQRYVGAETQSSCTVFDAETGMSPSKRCKLLGRRWATKSPGRRLSHLARRRITFSSANLAAGTSGAAGSRARQILVDAKKLELLSRRKSPRKTPKKTPNKSPKKKTRTPSSSAKKKLAMRFRKMTGEIENTVPSTSADVLKSISKRALFQSPDKKKESSLFLPNTFGLSTFENSPSKKLPAKRALFSSPNKRSPLKRSPFKRSPFLDKKRKRADSEESHPSKMPRSMSTMSDVVRPSESETRTLLNRTKSDIELSSMVRQPLGELSAVHKKKLQWAVYEALRSQNVTPTHKQFKLFASVLARVTRRLMLNITLGQPRPEGSTTERMLRIAKHHVIAVIKGKSVEEIISEYNRQKAKTFKPQGYIGIEEFNRLESMSKENILRDKIENAINSSSKVMMNLHSKFTPNNRIERIRKVINFGDDENR